MKALAVFALSAAALVAQTGASGVLSVTAVRSWSLGDVTRVAIEVSGEFEYHTERLHNPERIYFDVFRARPRIDSRRVYSKEINDRQVQRLRVAETLPGVTRVVLDLGADVEAATSQLANPSRLVIELRSTSASAPPAERPAPKPVRQFSPAAPPSSAPPPAGPPPGGAVLKSERPRTDVPSHLKTLLKPDPIELARLEPPKAAPEPPKAPAPVPEAASPKPELTVLDPARAAPARAAAKVPSASLPAPPPSAVRDDPGKAARRTAAGQNSLIRALGLKINRVVIDPGHGGHDQGTEGPHGLLEKELVLDVAMRLGKLVEERMGAEVIYTRSDDTFIPLEGRTGLANEKKADLFLSIHANSSPLPRIAGVETFYLNFTGSQDALDVAARENASSQKSIFELRDLIQKITLHDKAEESKEFAGRLQASLYAFSSRNVSGTKNRGVKRAPFVVLIGATMPSVLAEIGFLSNTKEEALLKKPDYRQKLADALFRGVQRYADGLSHFQMAQGQQAATQ